MNKICVPNIGEYNLPYVHYCDNCGKLTFHNMKQINRNEYGDLYKNAICYCCNTSRVVIIKYSSFIAYCHGCEKDTDHKYRTGQNEDKIIGDCVFCGLDIKKIKLRRSCL